MTVPSAVDSPTHELTNGPSRHPVTRSGARLVLPSFGVDADAIAFVDEGRDLHDQPGLERRRLHLCAGRRALDPGHGLFDDEIDRLRQLDADRLGVVELDANHRVGNEIELRVAE